MRLHTIILLCLISQVFGDAANSPSIIIVGAGASGIAASSKLLQNDFKNVLLLEAENRLGGRIRTVTFDGYSVDLGAEWVHGEKGNAAYELAAPLDLVDNSSQFINYHLYDSSGADLDPAISQNLTSFFLSMLINVDDVFKDQNGSVGDVFEKHYETYFAQHPEFNETLKRSLLRHYNLMQSAQDAADDWHDVSINGYMEFHDSEGNHLVNWKDRGYSTILDILMKKLPNPEEELPISNKTILNKEVIKIDYSGDDKVKVTTHDGNEYEADHVIVTPSLGVLKAEYETLFNPPLPEEKIKSIKSLGYGTALKIFLSFEEPWWDDSEEISGFGMLWNQDDENKLLHDSEKDWYLDIMGFWLVKHKPRLLAGWVSGKGARKLELVPDDKVIDQTMSMLRDFLGSDYNITDPTGMIKSGWYHNKHFRGTYSYRSTASDELSEPRKKLAEPIIKQGKPMVLFAGEATNTHHPATVHGAVETGWREADRLIQYYSNTKDGST